MLKAAKSRKAFSIAICKKMDHNFFEIILILYKFWINDELQIIPKNLKSSL